jgi:hypothetical protein
MTEDQASELIAWTREGVLWMKGIVLAGGVLWGVLSFLLISWASRVRTPL